MCILRVSHRNSEAEIIGNFTRMVIRLGNVLRQLLNFLSPSDLLLLELLSHYGQKSIRSFATILVTILEFLLFSFINLLFGRKLISTCGVRAGEAES